MNRTAGSWTAFSYRSLFCVNHGLLLFLPNSRRKPMNSGVKYRARSPMIRPLQLAAFRNAAPTVQRSRADQLEFDETASIGRGDRRCVIEPLEFMRPKDEHVERVTSARGPELV